MALLSRLGEQYERDHEKDLREQLAYLPTEAHGVGWQAPGAAGFVYGQLGEGEETVHGAAGCGVGGRGCGRVQGGGAARVAREVGLARAARSQRFCAGWRTCARVAAPHDASSALRAQAASPLVP